MKSLPPFILAIFCSVVIKAQVPTITGFSPVSGIVGASVTINGTNFSPVPGNNVVYFGNVKASVTAATGTAITVLIPASVAQLPVTVTTNGLTAYSSTAFNPTFPDTLALANSMFAAPVSFPSGAGPNGIKACDLDNDGKPDLAQVRDSANMLSIFRNTSNGSSLSFDTKIDYPTGTNPRTLAFGDLDGDGKLDLVVVNQNSNSISVFRNTSTQPGIISFAAKIDFPTNTDPKSLTIADIDNDGKPDIVVNTYLGGTLSVLRNTSVSGNIAFESRKDFDLEYSSYAIASADLNLDGKIDIIVPSTEFYNPLVVFQNTSTPGNISFAALQKFSGRQGASYINVGDFDLDGLPDIVISSPSLQIYHNSSTVGGAISFDEPFGDGLSLNTLSGAALANIDNDAKPELVIMESNARKVAVFALTYNQSNRFGLSGKFAINAQVGSFFICDLNADGKTDIAISDKNTRSISILTNDGKEFGLNSFSPPSGTIGQQVYISGVNLPGTTSVSFGGIPAASFQYESHINSISAILGNGASGNVSVSNGTTTISMPNFKYLLPPVISSFTPAKAGKGDTVVIRGQQFGITIGINFGSQPAKSFQIVSDSILTAVVDTGVSGSITVYTDWGPTTKAGFEYIPPPVIRSITPADASPGALMTIKGNYFSGITGLTIGKDSITAYTLVSDSVITTSINKILGGAVSVTNKYGTAIFGGFYNGPVITSIDTLKGRAGDIVNIYGKNFAGQPSGNVVLIGGIRASIVSGNNNHLQVKVPKGAGYSLISVAVNQLTAYYSIPFLPTAVKAGAIAPFSFLPKVELTAPHYQMAGVDVADLDGDGKPDFVTNSDSYSKLLVYRNVSSGTNIDFTLHEIASPGYFTKINLSDINSDGKPDIITSVNNSIVVLQNISTPGNIAFSSAVALPFKHFSRHRLNVIDMDGDGMPDIVGTAAINSGTSSADQLFILRNISTSTQIGFVSSYTKDFYSQCTAVGDLDGDNKPEMVVSTGGSNTYVFKNRSSAGLFSFDDPTVLYSDNGINRVMISDIDNDGRPDVVGNAYQSKFVSFKNYSTPSYLSFSVQTIFNSTINLFDFGMHDLTGNGLPDVVGVSLQASAITFLENKADIDNVIFKAPIEVAVSPNPMDMSIGDFDGDEKPDLVVIFPNTNKIGIYRNHIGASSIVQLCPPTSGAQVSTDASGSVFQWQEDSGSGFANISDNGNFMGSSTNSLSLTNIPSAWYGRKYRCLVDGNAGEVFELNFRNFWTGAINNNWENPANWSCGNIPDENTDVVINSGSVVISNNTTIRSLKVSPGVSIHVNQGVQLTVRY